MRLNRWFLNTFFFPITKEIVSQVRPIGCPSYTIFSPSPIFFVIPSGAQWVHKGGTFPPFLNRKMHHPCMGQKKKTKINTLLVHCQFDHRAHNECYSDYSMIHNGPVVVFLSGSITNCCSMMGIFTLVPPKERSPTVKEGSLFCVVFVMLRTTQSHVEHGWSCSYPFLKSS